MPAFDGSDDFVGIGSPCEGLGHFVGLLDGPANDLVGAEPLDREQNDPGAPHVLLRRVAIPDQGTKATAVSRQEGNRNPVAHAQDSHTPAPVGIPTGIQSLGFDRAVSWQYPVPKN